MAPEWKEFNGWVEQATTGSEWNEEVGEILKIVRLEQISL